MATASVLTVNVVEVAPPVMFTDAGTVAFVLFEDSVTVIPPEGAAPVIVTVPVEAIVPVTVVGFRVTLLMAGGATTSCAVAVPLRVPVMVAYALFVTGNVLIVNVALLLPDGTVTDAGTVAFELFEDRVTTSPPEPASPLRVTVPVEVVPPRTVVGLTETLETVASVTVSTAV